MGRDAKVPFIRHDFQIEEWKAVARVLVLVWKRAGYFPVQLAAPFLEEVLYGSAVSSCKDGFLQYVSDQERQILLRALDDIDSVEMETLLDLLDVHECHQGSVYKPMCFLLAFVLYILIITVNLTLILTVIMEKSLHEPMYIFLSNLCVNSLYGTIGFYPKFLLDLQADTHTITYSWCITQAYVIYTSVMCEITLLTVMSYDRYVAICRPLQYHSILTPHAVLKLLVVAWAYPLLTSVASVILTLRIPICGSHIRKLFCDNPSILKLGCSLAIANQVWSMLLITAYCIQFVLILISYARIVQVCISSSEGRTKFAKTCVPHILVIAIFIMTTLFDVSYSWVGSENLPISVRNALAIQFLILPPLSNPITYGLQLPQIRKAVFRQGCKHKMCHQR
ncbi:olfactory receptor 6N1-like [Alosa sapidissima]|uniref:olfactory receptor 6N1-like n=1 Tax=Alosa sapidissima TaxID=34773 RepID=UPI001C09C6B2|nr:olfactory receptor 6N1-like [Alosa sapidissima]